jgi:GNAT superfamily N-acetyltransferase
LVGQPGDSATWHPPAADLVVERLEFTDLDTDTGGFREILKRPLGEFELRTIGAEQVGNCLWIDALLTFCGSMEGFLRHGFGFSLCRNDKVLAEGYAPLLGQSTMEIGVKTAEEHRGQGFATLVSAYVIEECLRRDWTVAWSCELDNPASAVIARKLGFCGERTYPVYVYRSTPS